MSTVSSRSERSDRATSSCITACCRILGEPRRNRAAEDLLHLAVERLIAAGQDETATRLYCQFADSTLSWREDSRNPDEKSRLWGVGQYSRESAASGPCLPPVRPYHAPPAGPYLRPVSAADVLGATDRQRRARAEFARLWIDGRHNAAVARRNAELATELATVAELAANL